MYTNTKKQRCFIDLSQQRNTCCLNYMCLCHVHPFHWHQFLIQFSRGAGQLWGYSIRPKSLGERLYCCTQESNRHQSAFSADFVMMSAQPLCAVTRCCRHLYAHYQFQTHRNTAHTGRNGEHCCSPTLLRRTSCKEQGKCHKKTGHRYKKEKGRKKCFVVLSYFAEVCLSCSLPS